ncbi:MULTISPECIES: MvdD family ATP-grasp ribosomal peptide maturase [Sorangium]|uniref:Carboxylate-amine ligase n=1 Tax=Sorangium cellulosum TaxID=56 RepID=A0A4P2R1D5_SORCE|nr:MULTISPECIES: MvdD family ATP-grasp ribosomal peptide maturase [Sorangium]AUX36458.1 carboxylate-amine ligase [Sorangium cellulosum]WCQ95756.1 ribosomal protein S6 glutaminyl transferase [Sorangium sp. Soce836]
MTVLIITHSEDNECIARVAAAIERLGGRAFRFDTDAFPQGARLALAAGPGAGRSTLRTGAGGGELDLGDVTAVWYRRVAFGRGLPASMDPQLRSASVQEAKQTVEGLLSALRVPQVDPLPAVRFASNKQVQLDIAREVGLDTPRTLTTNDAEAARAFAATCPGGVVAKMLSSFAVYRGGEEHVVFTNALRDEDLADMRGLSLCPMTFQERIPKARELRVTVVGERVFAASIDPEAAPGAEVDWRRQGLELIDAWRKDALPPDVETGVLRLMDQLGLNYGALDILRTPDGRHVFLEVNPVGEFFWLERSPGLPISEALAEVLLGKAPRRGSWSAFLHAPVTQPR